MENSQDVGHILTFSEDLHMPSLLMSLLPLYPFPRIFLHVSVHFITSSLSFSLLSPLPSPSLSPSPRLSQVVFTECSKQGRQRQLDNCSEERYSPQPKAGQEGDEGRGTSSDPTPAESPQTRHGDYCSSPGHGGRGGGRGSALAKSSLSHNILS